jgi:hypothetical protein
LCDCLVAPPMSDCCRREERGGRAEAQETANDSTPTNKKRRSWGDLV